MISSAILEAWAHMAGDPDLPLIRWLIEGAPAGILQEPECVGVFPLVDEDPTYEFPLAWYDERFMNYTSMEESPRANDVLDKLVKERHVLDFKDIDQAKRYLGGRTPVLNKMALITVLKDGALEHRLIFDCRVSGANSNTI